nr:APC family permease [uncultured Oscillibacter sp.]
MLSDVIIVLCFNTFFAFTSIRGANVSGKFQTACVILLAAAALFVCGSGFTKGDVSNTSPLFTSAAGFTSVMLMVPGFMSGFNAIPQGVEEADVKPKTVGRLVVGAVWGSAIFYILIIAGLAFAVPYEDRAADGLVVIEAVRTMFHGNRLAVGFVTFASLVGMLTTWNAAFMAGSRFLNSMSRAKLIPPVFSDLHPKYQTPYKAVILLWILGVIAAFLGKASALYYGLMDINGLTVVVSWLLISIAFLKIRKNMPDLERPFFVKRGKTVGIISVVFCIGWLFLYTPWGPSGLLKGEWIALGVYALIALAVYLTWNRREGNVKHDEMLELLFGRKF